MRAPLTPQIIARGLPVAAREQYAVVALDGEGKLVDS
jgi:hypothetical protein